MLPTTPYRKPKRNKKRGGFEPPNPKDYDLNVAHLTTLLPLLKRTYRESNPGLGLRRAVHYHYAIGPNNRRKFSLGIEPRAFRV